MAQLLFTGVQHNFTKEQKNRVMGELKQTAFYADKPKSERLVETEILCPVCDAALKLWQQGGSITLFCQEHGALIAFLASSW